MAVKANAQITISRIVDIQATYRYYLLQGSTLAKPPAPTEFPPAKVSMPQFTNLISSATDDNGNIYNGIGYKDGSRWSQSGGTEVALADGRITGWIPYTSDATYRVQNVYAVSGTFSSSYVNGYYMIGALQDGTIECTANYRVTYDSATNIATITPQRDYTKFRLSGYAWSDPPIVTCNEEIVYDTTGSWEDSEPAYVDGSTNSLYFVDCTVFCDGTFTYSPVSLSSSYEAAKAAYNKANAVSKSLAAWCHENDTTLIDGSKIYAGSIGALQIDVVDLFAQDIVATGTISGAKLIGEEILIGEGGDSSVISLCGGSGIISYSEIGDLQEKGLLISSAESGLNIGLDSRRNIWIHAGDELNSASSGSYSEINCTETVGLNMGYLTWGLDADGASYKKRSDITLNNGYMRLSADCIYLRPEEKIEIPYGIGIHGLDLDGNSYEMLRMGGSSGEPICIIGDGLYTNSIGRTNICGGTQITLLTANTRVSLSTNSSGQNMFYPITNNSVYLGGASNRWLAVYSANATIQTSDAREKENILPVQSSELFDRLKPVQYNFIEGNGKTCYGLIAQDIVKVLDDLGIGENELDLVHHDYWTDEETGEAQERYGVAYTNLIALLVYEVQNLKKEVRRLSHETGTN